MKTVNTINLITMDDKKRILLVKRADNQQESGLWSLPGGTKRENETLEQCLMREIKEELSCLVVKYSFLKSYKIKNDSKTVIANYYIGLIKGYIKLNKQELSGYQWFAKENLPNKLAYNQNKVIADFILNRLPSSKIFMSRKISRKSPKLKNCSI